MTHAVEVDGVSKKFGSLAAVNNVSFNIESGEFFCLIGPSGSGKTTTLRLLAGLVQPDSGRILIHGDDYTHVPTFKRPISMVFQTWALFPHLTVFDNVAFGLRMRNAPRQTIQEEVRKTLELVRMSEYANRKPRELSGGQQQRVGIARALVVRPDIILLDEPLGNLDFKLQLQLQEELSQMHRQLRITFVYVTHDQRQAMALGERVCVMNNGNIEQLDETAKVYSKPSNVFVARFVGESNIVEGSVKSSGGGKNTVETVLGSFVFDGGSFQREQRVWLFWRPENTLIASESASGDYAFEGVVSAIETSGQVTQYVVDVGGIPIRAVKTGLPDPEIGEKAKVSVGVKRDQILLLDTPSVSETGQVERAVLGA
ncbi:MAG: ABC transporter ATP-binding protein [Thaumarchaeota archaeon]|nr:MAG: ABC transporter ATP-binding protein [Nitrososphaerota archaeon]